MKFKIQKFVRHLINVIFGHIWCTFRGQLFLPVTYYPDEGDPNGTKALLTMPGTRFAELFCSKPGYQPMRWQVGKIDATTEIKGITMKGIAIRMGDVEWESDICAFVSHLHFCKD